MKVRILTSYTWRDNGNGEHLKGGNVDKISREIVQRLKRHFTDEEVHHFIDHSGVQNDAINERVMTEISRSDYFLVFLSPNYISREATTSEFVAISSRNDSLRNPKTSEASPREYPRIIYIYLEEIPQLSALNPASEIVRSLQGVRYFDFTDLKDSPGEPAWNKLCQEIADIIIKQTETRDVIHRREPSLESLWSGSQTFPSAINEARSDRLKKLTSSIEEPIKGLPFRGALIDRLLTEFEGEIDRINQGAYSKNISLDESFLQRAIAIFGPAHAAHAVSIDSYSEFWTSGDNISSKDQYISVQPLRTFRLFVFSNSMSMVAHRRTMRDHFVRYGREGRVLFTDRETWEKYIEEIFVEEIDEVIDADFGILRYSAFFPDTTRFGEAWLRKGSISFKPLEIEGIDGWRKRFMEDLEAQAQPGGRIALGAGGARAWREEFGDDDDLWFAEVARTFSRERTRSVAISEVNPIAGAGILHTVLFSKEMGSDNAVAQIRSIIPGLLNMRGMDGAPLIEAAWYGRSSSQASIVDPAHGGNLQLHDDQERWPAILMMRFKSESALQEYYRDYSHSKARMRLYRSFPHPDIGGLIDAIGITESAEVKKALGIALEAIASSYMKRVDYIEESPNSYLSLLDSLYKFD